MRSAFAVIRHCCLLFNHTPPVALQPIHRPLVASAVWPSIPQVQARAMVDEWDHPLRPGLRLVANPAKLSVTPVRKDLPPPLLGQHTREVLADLLGLDAGQMDALARDGVIA